MVPVAANAGNLPMTPNRLAFRLETRWTPARDGVPPSYELTLANTGNMPVTGFRLAVCGPARIDPGATNEGGRLVERL